MFIQVLPYCRYIVTSSVDHGFCRRGYKEASGGEARGEMTRAFISPATKQRAQSASTNQVTTDRRVR